MEQIEHRAPCVTSDMLTGATVVSVRKSLTYAWCSQDVFQIFNIEIEVPNLDFRCFGIWDLAFM